MPVVSATSASYGCAKCRRAKRGCKFCREPGPVKVDDAGEEYYWVTRIAEERAGKYLVFWFGYPAPTWEPKAVIRKDAPLRVKEWEAMKKRVKTMYGR